MYKKIIAVILLLSINNFVMAAGYWAYDSATGTYVRHEEETNTVQKNSQKQLFMTIQQTIIIADI